MFNITNRNNLLDDLQEIIVKQRRITRTLSEYQKEPAFFFSCELVERFRKYKIRGVSLDKTMRYNDRIQQETFWEYIEDLQKSPRMIHLVLMEFEGYKSKFKELQELNEQFIQLIEKLPENIK